MSKRIQVIRDSFVITDTSNNEIIFEGDKSIYTYDFRLFNQGVIKFIPTIGVNGLYQNPPVIQLSDAVNFEDVAFTSATFLNFFRTRMQSDSISDFRIRHAEDTIFQDYGDIVSVLDKNKDLLKFGTNTNVGTASTGYTLWATGVDNAHETYVAQNVNSIDSLSSSSSSDTIEVRVEGHTETGGEKTFVVQYITLTGQTRVPLTTPLNRITRIVNETGTLLVGNIYGYENTALTTGKPTDTTKIHITIPAGKQQSRKCATALSNIDYWIITGFTGDVLTKTSSSAEISLEIRRSGGVFREVATISASNNHSGRYGGENSPLIIAPKNSDIRLTAIGSGTISVSGTISGYLAKTAI